jgi:hypothetical protein
MAGSTSTEAMTGPVTIGDLRREGKALEVGCTKCWHVVYMDPRNLPFHDDQAVPAAYQRMKCSRCGAKAGYSWPDGRVGGVTGQCPPVLKLADLAFQAFSHDLWL